MSRNLPFYQMYPADAETDENYRSMNDTELGFYWRCLNHAWMNSGLPADPEERSRILKTPRKTADQNWTRVGRCFELTEDQSRFINRRQERERTKANEKSERATSSVRTRYERRSNVGVRASDSDSVSGSVFVSSEGSAEGNRGFGEELEALIGAFLAAGVMLSEPQIYQAVQEWEHVPQEERAAAVLCAQTKAKTNEAKYMGLPASFIRKAEWTARGPGRVLPDPLGKRDLAHETAARNFAANRGKERAF